MDAGVRASDDDRMRVVSALERHTVAGRISLEEYSDRVGRALAAATRGDLAAVTADLPAIPTPPAQPEEPGPRTVSRELLLTFAIAIITVVVLTVILAVAR